MYNAERYLNECINSIINQTYQDYELILVNDGSTDRSLQICKKYNNLYPSKVKIINQENHGSFLARSKGIQLADGDFIIFVDSDDTVRNDAFEKISSHISDKVDIVCFGTSSSQDYKVTHPGTVLAKNNTYLGKTQIFELLCTSRKLNQLWNRATRRSCFLEAKSANDIPNLKFGEDLYQFTQIVDSIRAGYYFSDQIYYYRYSENSVSKHYYSNRFGEISAVRLDLRERATNWEEQYHIHNLKNGVDAISIQEICEFCDLAASTSNLEVLSNALSIVRNSNFFHFSCTNTDAIRKSKITQKIKIILIKHQFVILYSLILKLGNILKFRR